MAIYGYARVSTVEQGEGTSIEEQTRKIEGASMMMGVKLAQMFVDVGVSGGLPLSERPEGGELYGQLVGGDVLIAAKMDRLFRSASDALATAEKLAKIGVDLVLLDMGTEPVTKNGSSKLFFTMLAAFAEWERTRIAERMDDGRKGKMARGGHIGGPPPYGFTVVGGGRSAMKVPNEQEQAVITRAKRYRAEGISFGGIASRFTAEGIMSRKGRPFEAMQIHRMVK